MIKVIGHIERMITRYAFNSADFIFLHFYTSRLEPATVAERYIPLDYNPLLGDSSAYKYVSHPKADIYNHWLANIGTKPLFA